MIPITTFAGKTVAVFGLGASGLLSARALKQGGAEVVAFDDEPKMLAQAQAAGIATQDLRELDWSDCRAGAGPRRATHASDAALDGRPRAQSRTSRSSAISSCSAVSAHAGGAEPARRHHRHQRQIHHHRADHAYAPAPDATRRSAATSACRFWRSRRCRRSRVYVLEVSSYQIDLRPRSKPPSASCSTSPRIISTPRQHGQLCRHQGRLVPAWSQAARR